MISGLLRAPEKAQELLGERLPRVGHPVRRVVRLLSSPNRIMRGFESWLRTRRVTGITWLRTSTCCTTYRTRQHSGRRCKDNLTILSMKYQCER